MVTKKSYSRFLKAILLAFLTCIFIAPLQANQVTASSAQVLAAGFLSKQASISVTKLSLAYTEYTPSGEPVYFVFNVNSNNGFIIVSAEDAASPVIGYSTKGQFKIPDAASNIGHWMTNRKKEIIRIRANKIQATLSIKDEWTLSPGSTTNTRNKNSGNVTTLSVSPL